MPAAALDDPSAALVEIPGATFVMGDPEGDANEAPRTVTVPGFTLMKFEVTNAQFARFVDATGYVTDAERGKRGSVWRGRRWRWVAGADWRHPHGPDSSIADAAGHPVVQVSWNDAVAFCAHHGLRLPTDPEWELAARGTDGRTYVWGNEPPRSGGTLRGNFGTMDCCAPDAIDGFERIAPVAQYPHGVSRQGLWDLAGNVWEWTASDFPGRPDFVSLRGAGWGNSRYCVRAAYRHMNPRDRGLGMVGIRCAGDAGEPAK